MKANYLSQTPLMKLSANEAAYTSRPYQAQHYVVNSADKQQVKFQTLAVNKSAKPNSHYL